MNQTVFTDVQIQTTIHQIAHGIIKHASMRPDVIVPVMNGALLFASDLLRALYPGLNPIVIPIKMSRLPHYLQPGKFLVAGQGSWMQNTGPLMRDKRVMLIDTVFDTGATIEAAKRLLEPKQVRSITSAVLVWKNLPDAKGRPDHYGFDLKGDPSFLFGYGLDKDYIFRGTRDIFVER